MSCRLTDVQDLAYGFLDEENERRVRGHLDGCPRCVADLERMDGEKDVLSRAVSTPLPVPARSRPREIAALPLAFAAALLLSLLGMLFTRPPAPAADDRTAAFVPLAQQKKKQSKQDEDGKDVKPPVKKAPEVPPVKKGPLPPSKKDLLDKKGPKHPPIKKRPDVPPVKKGPKPVLKNPNPDTKSPKHPPIKKGPKMPPVKKAPKTDGDGAKQIPLKLKRLYLELKRTKDPAERDRIEDEIAKLKALLNGVKKPAPPKKAPVKKTPRDGKAPKK